MRVSRIGTLHYVADCVENEGFDYCFKNYSDFAEVKDEKFHELRKAYLEARAALVAYVDLED